MRAAMTSSEIERYFDALVRRPRIRLQPRAVLFQDGTCPRPNECHQNVDRWMAEKVGYVAVRGWAISAVGGDYPGAPLCLEAHSVVRSRAGTRFLDITLKQAVAFLRHVGTDSEFELMRTDRAQVWWPAGDPFSAPIFMPELDSGSGGHHF